MKRSEKIEGVMLSHPDKLLIRESNVTKRDLAEYYSRVQRWLLPELINRPLSLVRCPEGSGKNCFFQKHPRDQMSRGITRVRLKEKSGSDEYLVVKTIRDVIELVQMNVIEFHVWGAQAPQSEFPDRIVFDLDPAPDVRASAVVEAATLLRETLGMLDLHCFPRVSGGKGLHVVVPLTRENTWDEVRLFSQSIAKLLERRYPDRYTANAIKTKRKGRVFIDYLRNSRGATSIANYSIRARPEASIAVPLAWDEVHPRMKFNSFTIETIFKRLGARFRDPWRDIERFARALPGETAADLPKRKRAASSRVNRIIQR